MRTHASSKAAVAALLLAFSCSGGRKEPPPRSEVQGLLQQLAETEKREAEADVNPNLGVKITWTVDSVEVRPQPENESWPYAGTIRFTVESQTPELDSVATSRFEKVYEYLWDLEAGTWVLQ